jgi:hypothetical protein
MQSYLSFALSAGGGCPEIRALDPYRVTRITPDYPLDLLNAMNMIMNGATIIEELTEVQQTVAQLLAQLRAREAKKLIMHLYQSRKQYRLVCERPNKGNTAIEREIISSYQLAQSLGFKGDFRAWEHLVRSHE